MKPTIFNIKNLIMIELIIIPTIFTLFMLEGQRKDMRWKDDGKKKRN